MEVAEYEQKLLAKLKAESGGAIERFQAEYELIEGRLSLPRLLHSLGVANTARMLAIKCGDDADKAYLAGLCHDIAKEMPKDEMLAYVKRSPMADDEAVLQNKSLWHAPAGYVLLKELADKYPSFDEDVQAACLWHTLGRLEMSRLEQQVFVADLIEPGRDFPDLAEIRAAAEMNLTHGTAACLAGAIRFLELQNKFVHPLAYEAYAYYKALSDEEEIMLENMNENLKENLTEIISHAEATERELATCSFSSDENSAAKLDVDDLQALVLAAAAYGYAKKARDIVGVDLRGISPVADYFLIFSGSNKPQIRAICDNIEEKLAEQGLRPLRTEGYNEAEWVLLDYGNLIVHIFDDEQREYYNLEHLWGDAPAYRFMPAE